MEGKGREEKEGIEQDGMGKEEREERKEKKGKKEEGKGRVV